MVGFRESQALEPLQNHQKHSKTPENRLSGFCQNPLQVEVWVSRSGCLESAASVQYRLGRLDRSERADYDLKRESLEEQNLWLKYFALQNRSFC